MKTHRSILFAVPLLLLSLSLGWAGIALSSAEPSNESTSEAPRIHALLIGANTNKEKPFHASPGAGRDCTDFAALLHDRFNIPKSQITLLTGESVTTEAFTKALTKVFVNDARSGDSVIFYYRKKGSGRDSCNLRLGFPQLSVRSDLIFHLAAEAADTRLVTHVELAGDPFMTEARRFGNHHRQHCLTPVILLHRIQILLRKPEVIEPCSYDPSTNRPIPVPGRGVIRTDDLGDVLTNLLLNPELRQQPLPELLGAEIPTAPQG